MTRVATNFFPKTTIKTWGLVAGLVDQGADRIVATVNAVLKCGAGEHVAIAASQNGGVMGGVAGGLPAPAWLGKSIRRMVDVV